MGLFSSLVGGLAGATKLGAAVAHKTTETFDEMAEIGGARGVFRAFTQSLTGVGELLNVGAHKFSEAASGISDGFGFIGSSVKTMLGGFTSEPSIVAEAAPKLGRSADLYNCVAAATQKNTQFDVKVEEVLGCLAAQNFSVTGATTQVAASAGR